MRNRIETLIQVNTVDKPKLNDVFQFHIFGCCFIFLVFPFYKKQLLKTCFSDGHKEKIFENSCPFSA